MVNYKTLSDNELLQLLKGSDHAAFNEIYHRYFNLTYIHAYKKLRDEEQAKDIIQDLFASLWFKREFNLPSTNLAGYLFTAIRNRIFDLFAHEQVKTKHIDSLKDFVQVYTNAPTDHLVREKELSAYIERSIAQLPPKMRHMFELSRKEQLSYQEIAERMNTTENNVSKQVNNALRILRAKMGILIAVCWLLK